MNGVRKFCRIPVIFRNGLMISSIIGALLMPVSAQGLPKDALGKLASEEFKVREQGYLELLKWAKSNLKTSPEMLHAKWKVTDDPEVKSRFYGVMKESVILRKFGRGPGFVGVQMEDVRLNGQEGIKAVRISFVMPNTPAQKFGLAIGDVVLGVDDLIFNDVNDRRAARDMMSDYIQSKHPGDVITLRILRAEKKIDKKVELMLRPEEADIGPFGRDRMRRAGERERSREQFFEKWLNEMKG